MKTMSPSPTAATTLSPLIGSGGGEEIKLYVGNLDHTTDENRLLAVFGVFGLVTGVFIPKEPDTSCHRGFGFVNFASRDSAANAVSKMNDSQLDGRTIRVTEGVDIRDPSSKLDMPRKRGRPTGPLTKYAHLLPRQKAPQQTQPQRIDGVPKNAIKVMLNTPNPFKTGTGTQITPQLPPPLPPTLPPPPRQTQKQKQGKRKQLHAVTPCKGVYECSFGAALSFAARSMLNTAQQLLRWAAEPDAGLRSFAESPLARSRRILLPYYRNNMGRPADPRDGFVFFRENCEGSSVEGASAPRCEACSKGKKNAESNIKGSHRPHPKRASCQATIKNIACDPVLAKLEIEALRAENKKLRNTIKALEKEKEDEKNVLMSSDEPNETSTSEIFIV